MKKIFIKPLNKLIELNKPIIQLTFDDVIIYRNFIFLLEEYIIYSIDDVVKDFDKHILRIMNPFHLELNDKKILNSLYKRISNTLNENQRQKISFIETEILNILEEISLDSEIKITYENNFSIINLLNIFRVSICEAKCEDYLESLITYIKVNLEINNFNVIISNGITKILSNQELNLLEKELGLLSIHIIDLELVSKVEKGVDLMIDSDWCSF
ncbi:MAG: type II-A CRISPR-associated protein Csn2 [Prevotella sp.]|nr:type II-A CRISPR-associated protein Csn2 [Staphylococcus sp.]MCM1350666.1 type II-A CRISPR-associated protein Csn2 [Prevotella sp.]